ncbi:hypothetical protein M0R45_009475 [Rubus argutus]|uniref:AMP-binding enzyme C-terminal domain-containing protein n=1 Tax=Rubus argutus TaxID=59490 RepID=A0AAW1Y452_RUBAR
MGGAPTVLNTIVNAPENDRRPLPGKVVVMTGAAPPPSQFALGNPSGIPSLEMNRQKLRRDRGLQHIGMEELDVKDPVTMKSVSCDAKTMGEVMFRGNTVMNGYLKDNKATKDAFESGWFHSGDLAIRHPDGYIEIKDRSKDIIISGGENISTIEVESVLFRHPDVLEAAIVGRPDEYWGETPCAFVKLKDGCNASAEDIIKFCRGRLPHYMAPRTVIFEDLPKTSTGKVQKYVLREKAKAMGSFQEQHQQTVKLGIVSW